MPSTPVVVLDSTLTDIADAIRGKNGSSDTYKPSEMPAAITAIPSGGTDLGNAREVSNSGTFQRPEQNFTFLLPSTVLDIGEYALSYALEFCRMVTKADLSSLTSVTGSGGMRKMCHSCTDLTSLDLSSLTTISGYEALSEAFYDCGRLVDIDLSSLTTISGDSALKCAFSTCSSLTTVNLDSVVSITGSSALYRAFYRCTSLSSISFGSLTNLTALYGFDEAFNGCTSLGSLSFPALTASSFGSRTSQFNDMLSGCSNVTVHFPAAIQSTIGSWTSVTNGFSGTNTTVLFDL